MNKKNIQLSGLFVVVVTIVMCSAWYTITTKLDTPINAKNDKKLYYLIKPGVSLKEVSFGLYQEKIVDNPYYLILAAKLLGYESRIKAGEYLLPLSLTYRELLEKFIQGKVIQHALTLVEGWSYIEVMHAINNNVHLIKKLPSNIDKKNIMEKLGAPNIDAEGRFFPETYFFPSGTTDIDFLHRAYIKMEHVLAEEWSGRALDLPYKQPIEALIMASIVEKETAVANERSEIAGVFVRRLKKGMKLQADPTVIYAIRQTYDGNIRRKDLKIDSPYNTYFYRGLPPTSIGLVGVESIHATLHPENGDSLYFVAKNDGTHHFSKTLAEHNRAVKKYQLGKK